jgi:hypothetical protein
MFLLRSCEKIHVSYKACIYISIMALSSPSGQNYKTKNKNKSI